MVPFIKGPYEGLPFHRFPLLAFYNANFSVIKTLFKIKANKALSLFCFYIVFCFYIIKTEHKTEQAIYQYGVVGDAVISDVPAVENLKFKSAVREEESKSYSNKTCHNYFHFTL
jgi:Ca2+/Na+ antiporter